MSDLERDPFEDDEPKTNPLNAPLETEEEEIFNRPYASEHNRTYMYGGIIDSVPIDLSDQSTWRRLTRMTERYDGMNRAYQASLETGHRDFEFLKAVAPELRYQDRKRVHNKLRYQKEGIIPIIVTILTLKPLSEPGHGSRLGAIETDEFGYLKINDFDDLPCNFKVGYIMRFSSTTLKDGENTKFFRLGWKASAERETPRRHGRATKETPRRQTETDRDATEILDIIKTKEDNGKSES